MSTPESFIAIGLLVSAALLSSAACADDVKKPTLTPKPTAAVGAASKPATPASPVAQKVTPGKELPESVKGVTITTPKLIYVLER